MIRLLSPHSMLPIAVNGVEVLPVDTESLLLGGDGCSKTIKLAFVKGTAPDRYADCAGGGKRQD